MAFYNFGIRLLHRVKSAQGEPAPFMKVEKAVHKLTGELGDFYGVDAGHLRLGGRADVVVIAPDGLDDDVTAYHEEIMPEFGGLSRMVNRNDRAVTATLIAGKIAYRGGQFAPWFGVSERAGRYLRAGADDPVATTVQP
jgi:N-acyl-D-aspartate/D-glutamate deacylase